MTTTYNMSTFTLRVPHLRLLPSLRVLLHLVQTPNNLVSLLKMMNNGPSPFYFPSSLAAHHHSKFPRQPRKIIVYSESMPRNQCMPTQILPYSALFLKTKNFTLQLAKHKNQPTSDFQRFRWIFDQIRPIIAVLFHLPTRPSTPSKFKTAMNTDLCSDLISSCYKKFHKNNKVQLFSKHILISSLPKGAKIFHLFLSFKIKDTYLPNIYNCTSCLCANGLTQVQGIYLN